MVSRRRRLRRAALALLCAGLGLGMVRPPPELAAPIEIVARGAHPSAQLVVERLIHEMRVARRLDERLRRAQLTVVVVPRRAQLTELPQFASLRGRRTFDGRPWERVRGTGGVRLHDGRVAVAIPEENVLFGWDDDAYPALSIAVHEIAHALHDRVLDDDDRARVDAAYRARLAAGGPFVDAYAGSNVREYFAQGVNAYFARYAGLEVRDAGWLYAHDRRLYAALARVFGPPPDRRFLSGRAPRRA